MGASWKSVATGQLPVTTDRIHSGRAIGHTVGNHGLTPLVTKERRTCSAALSARW
jgi:hypothetical protein